MAARIRSTVNSIDPLDESSRDDLVVGDVVTVQSLDSATTYAWALMYVPEGSTASFSGSATAVSPGSFTVDASGSYLVRLIVDAGRSTESTQYVRLRALTETLGLKLVAAGERRDEVAVIPVDADVVGWADEQNSNLIALEAGILDARPEISLTSGSAITTGDVLTVDSTVGGGHVVLASSTTASTAYVIGVSLETVGSSGMPVTVQTSVGRIVTVRFGSAPAASDQGKPVYLASSGQVTLTAPVASGTTVFRVGVLFDASHQRVIYQPQFVATNP